MTDTAIEQQDAPPADLGTQAQNSQPSVSAENDLDALLREYDEKTAQPEPATDNGTNGADVPNVTDDSIDDGILRDLNADTERANKLEGELASLKNEVHRQQEIAALESFSSDVQSRLPDHLPPDYAKNALLAAASSDPNLVAAWDTRNVPAAERAQAPALLRQAEALYQQLLKSPDTDPRKQQALNFIVQRGRYLEAVVYGPGILRKAVREIEDRAHKFQPVDSEATALKMEVAAAVRGASAKRIPEPQIAWGRLTANEGRREIMQQWGFDPGWKD